MDEQATALATSLHLWLTSPSAVADLNAYFAEPPPGQTAQSAYSGRFFERLGGGGDAPTVWDRFTAEDLLAVQMLSVSVPPETSIGILHGELGRKLNMLLRAIPTDVALGEVEASEHIADGAAADQAWNLLKQQPDTGWVTAGKLMARKRPHLLPVYDNVVRCALGAPKQLWQSLHAVLATEEAPTRTRLAELRASACIPGEVGNLRILDVVVWMGHRRHHQRTGCTAPGVANLNEADV